MNYGRDKVLASLPAQTGVNRSEHKLQKCRLSVQLQEEFHHSAIFNDLGSISFHAFLN